MKTLFRLIVLVLLVAGWGLAALSLHVVRAQGDRIVLIPKQRLGINDTYVDARQWTIQHVANHADLVERIIQSGKAENFAYVVDDPKGDVERQLQDALRDATNENAERTIKSLEETVRRHAKAAGAWWDLSAKR
jgi:hypothetical protein